MNIKTRYTQAMERLYIACIALAGVALIVITLIIPYGVFMRYAMHSPASWPEPAAVLMMIMFSFIGGAAIYRAKVHIAVMALVNAVDQTTRQLLKWAVHACVLLTTLFMIGYGSQLVSITWHQVIAEFPGLSVGLTYLPIPVSGFIMLLFLIEFTCCGDPPPSSIMYTDTRTDLE